MNIYAIIVTYNGMKWIDKCLSSFRSSSFKINIIVIDNESTDGTVEFIVENYKEVILIQNTKNLGFGKANNIGFKIALNNNADYVLLINQDAYVFHNTISDLIKLADNYSILSPMHLNGLGNALDHNFEIYFRDSLVKNDFINDIIIKRHLDDSYDVGFINAACWLIPITVIKKIGGFNPIFHHYGEDLHYYNRMNFHDIKMKLAPKVFISHDRETFGDNKIFNSKFILRALLIYYTDINVSFIALTKPKLILHLLSLKQIIQNLCKFRFLEVLNILESYALFLTKITSIYHGRKIEKTKGTHWL